MACVPPMQRLYYVLGHGGSFPTCSEGGTTAALAYEPPYFCPAGCTPAGRCYTNPKTEVIYLLALGQNSYTMNVSIRWQRGSETIYIDSDAARNRSNARNGHSDQQPGSAKHSFRAVMTCSSLNQRRFTCLAPSSAQSWESPTSQCPEPRRLGEVSRKVTKSLVVFTYW